MKKKIYWKKTAAITTAVALGCSMVGCGANSTKKSEVKNDQTEAAEETDLINTMNTVTGMKEDEVNVDKEETVYVIADENGTPSEIIVSEWLKNNSSDKILKDTTNLTEISNVKGDEAYTNTSEGIEWENKGSDIYYQGKSEKKLPVSVNVTYYLDGEQISPKDLAGKSGKVKIKYEYINNSSELVDINGSSEEIFTPFVMVTGLILPTDTFANVEVSNGDVISEGNNMIAIGFGMPGLSESLELDKNENLDLGLNLPGSFEITADVTDFNLGMSVTMCSNSLADLDDMNTDSLEDVNKDVDTLTDASKQLSDGAGKLADGTQTLKDGTKQIADGAVTLDDGANALSDNLLTAQEGSKEITGGLYSLNSAASQLFEGIEKVKTGADSLVAGYEGSEERNGAVAGARAVADGLSQLENQLQGFNLPDVSSQPKTLTEEQKNAVAEEIKKFLSSDEGKAVVSNYTQSFKQNVNAQLKANNVDLDAQTQYILDSVVSGVFEQAFINLYISSYETGMEKGMGTVLDEVSVQLNSYAPAIAQMKGAVSQLSGGSNQVADGVDQLYAGTKQLSDGLNTMYNGGSALSNGVEQLYLGSSELENGIGKLYDGSVSLKKGTSVLRLGSTKLNAGVDELQSGSVELKDGMVKFNEDGISKINTLVKEDLNNITSRVDAISEVNEKYELYGGIEEGKTSKEKFIIKVNGID